MLLYVDIKSALLLLINNLDNLTHQKNVDDLEKEYNVKIIIISLVLRLIFHNFILKFIPVDVCCFISHLRTIIINRTCAEQRRKFAIFPLSVTQA